MSDAAAIARSPRAAGLARDLAATARYLDGLEAALREHTPECGHPQTQWTLDAAIDELRAALGQAARSLDELTPGAP